MPEVHSHSINTVSANDGKCIFTRLLCSPHYCFFSRVTNAKTMDEGSGRNEVDVAAEAALVRDGRGILPARGRIKRRIFAGLVRILKLIKRSAVQVPIV
ncbi:hypothetical protein ACLOJK_016796 [Asimina triloba]